jgi:hypothetical protein
MADETLRAIAHHTTHLIIYAAGGATQSRRDSPTVRHRDNISQYAIGKGATNIIGRNKTKEQLMIQYTKDYIAKLLDKYMDGTSTLEEEDILAQYFAHESIPAEWEPYRLMFAEIEAMRPETKHQRRWLRWTAIAAVIAGVIYMAVPSPKTEYSQTKPLVAQADSSTTVTVPPDTMIQQKEEPKPISTKKRRMRKLEPTIHDYDKAYVLMAEAKQKQTDVERQIAQAEQEIIKAQLAAYGYIPVMQEDGTIIYINEQTEFIAYEE